MEEPHRAAGLSPARRRSSAAPAFFIRFALIGLLLYAVLFFPHAATSLPGRLLVAYLELLAGLAGGVVSAIDAGVAVNGHLISGRMSLAIVVDCAALDVQALFVAIVLAFPASWRQRLTGLALGLTTITAANVLRIAALYFVGARWPAHFGVLHEDFFPLGLVLATCACFALWALWARGRSNPDAAPVASSAAL